MNMKRLLIYFFCCPFVLHSQVFKNKLVEFRHINSKVLEYATTGGVDNAQLNSIDLNDDGIQDLFIFDRAGDVVLPFLYDAFTSRYLYAPEYRRQFPVLKDWVLAEDYNKDGIQDLFASSFNTEGIPGIELYKGIRGPSGIEYRKFDMGKSFKALYFSFGNGDAQIPIDFTDVPAIDDVDGDGDLDIILFEPGNNRVSFFKNVVKERGYSIDTLAFVLSDRCYGRFAESGFTSDIELSTHPDTCVSQFKSGNTTRHSGSTLLSFDLDGNQLQDLLVGDLSNEGIIALYNEGSRANAFMSSQNTMWPGISDPVNLAIFNVAFKIDIDKDQLTDIVVAPNQRSISENINNIWFYKNTGTSGQPQFQLETKSLFVDQMIDLGAGSDPCFVDVNQDGLIDLVVGTEGFFIKGTNIRDARLVLFQNIGNSNHPVFQLVDSNYLNFNQFALSQDAHFSFTPSFGDLDHDGDIDLLVGENQGQFFYCENTAGPGQPFQFKKPVYPYFDLSARSFSSPFLIDLNQDGLTDIVSGSRQNTNDANNVACGSFYYFQNQGTSGNSFFDPDYLKSPNTNCLGKIIVPAITSKSYTCPEFYNFGSSIKLFTGNIFGEAKMIGGITSDINAIYQFENTNFGRIKEGERLTLSLSDIDGDGILDMVTGNARGGLAFYETNLRTDGTTSVDESILSDVSLYPNPVQSKLNIDNRSMKYLLLSLMDVRGFKVNDYFINRESSICLDLEYLNSGVYFLVLNDGKKSICFKILKS